MAYRSGLLGNNQTMQSPLSSSTPQLGIPELDPRKRAAPAQPGGYNAQSAANAAGASAPLLAPPPPPPGAAPVATRRAAAAAPAAPVIAQVPSMRDPSTGLTPQQLAVMRGMSPALSVGAGMQMPPPPPPPAAAPARGAAAAPASTLPAGEQPWYNTDPNARIYPGPNNTLLNRADFLNYQKVLGQNGIPGAVQRTGPVPTGDPKTGQVVQATPTAAEVGTGPGPTGGATAQPVTTTPGVAPNIGQPPAPDVSADPAVQALIKEIQGRISGNTTTAMQRMNDRAQQQANASTQTLDRQLAGRGLSATNPLRVKGYGDIQNSVNEQMALRDAQLQQQAADQGIQLWNAATQAKNAGSLEEQVRNQETQFNQTLEQQKNQSFIDDLFKAVPALASAGSSPAVASLLKYLGLGGSAPSGSSPATPSESMQLELGNLNKLGYY